MKQIMRSYWALGLALVLGLGLTLGLSTWAGAQDGVEPAGFDAVGATITVNTTADDWANNSHCSLREAIQAANTNAPFNGCPAGSGWDTIILSAGTYGLTRGGGGEDDNVTDDLDVLESVTIQGASASLTTINGHAIDRVFHVVPKSQGAALDLQRVMVTHGVADEDSVGQCHTAIAAAKICHIDPAAVAANVTGDGAVQQAHR